MVFAIGALRSPARWKNNYARDDYITAIKKECSLGQITAVGQVQNLLLVFVFAILHDVGVTSAWKIIRQAMHICVRYSFHSWRAADENVLREQLRRKIFWSVYISDRHCSQNFGRPAALSEEDITIDLPINQDDEKLGAGTVDPSCQYTEATNLIRHVLLRQLGTKARIAFSPLAQQSESLQYQIETTKIWNDNSKPGTSQA